MMPLARQFTPQATKILIDIASDPGEEARSRIVTIGMPYDRDDTAARLLTWIAERLSASRGGGGAADLDGSKNEALMAIASVSQSKRRQ
jgi:hypothetical protein